MHTLFEILECWVVKNLLVCAGLLWIECDSRHILGIGTRLGANSDGGLLYSYTTGEKPTGGVMSAYSDRENDFFQFDSPLIPPPVWIFMAFVLFFFIVLCVCSGMNFQLRGRRLWSNVNPNPQLPRPQALPPMPQGSRTPIVDNDVPPDYTAVVDQKPAAGGSWNDYPKVARDKKLETPPPAYMTVAPFQ